MRISDWSSDVCSSDLVLARLVDRHSRVHGEGHRGHQCGRVVGGGGEVSVAHAPMMPRAAARRAVSLATAMQVMAAAWASTRTWPSPFIVTVAATITEPALHARSPAALGTLSASTVLARAWASHASAPASTMRNEPAAAMGPPPSMSTRSASAPAAATSTTPDVARSEEHTSELQSLMRTSYAVFCLKT